MGDKISFAIVTALLKRAEEEEKAEDRVFGRHDATDAGGEQKVVTRSRVENTDERYLAARCLWGLADHLNELPELKQSPTFLAIERWIVHIEEKLKKAEEARNKNACLVHANLPQGRAANEAPEQKSGHVMISYCWANKPIVNQLKSELSKHGVNTW